MDHVVLAALAWMAFAGTGPAQAPPVAAGAGTAWNASAGRAEGRAGACSPEALPAAERRRMAADYRRRLKTDGKARADAWLNEQGRLFHRRLVAEGVCPPPKGRTAGADSKAGASGKKVVRDRNGRPCKRTRLENRNVANLGGGAMQMVLVPVCAD